MAMGEEAGSPAVLGEPDTPWGTVRGRGFGGGGGGGGGGDGAPVTGGGPRPSFYSDIFTSLATLRRLQLVLVGRGMLSFIQVIHSHVSHHHGHHYRGNITHYSRYREPGLPCLPDAAANTLFPASHCCNFDTQWMADFYHYKLKLRGSLCVHISQRDRH